MEDIKLNIDSNKQLRLKFLDAIHPTLVNIRAEDWKYIYKLYNDKVLFDNGLFTGSFFICQERQILILEEYDISILDNNLIKTDQDVVLNLRLFDLKLNVTGIFSKLTDGSYIIHRLEQDKVVFSKNHFHKTTEFEIDLKKIQFETIRPT